MGRIVGSQAVYLLVRLRLPRACIGILRELFGSRAARIVVGGGAYRHGGATADGDGGDRYNRGMHPAAADAWSVAERVGLHEMHFRLGDGHPLDAPRVARCLPWGLTCR